MIRLKPSAKSILLLNRKLNTCIDTDLDKTKTVRNILVFKDDTKVKN